MAHALRVRTAVNPVQKLLLVQEKIAGQYALDVELLEKIAGGNRHRPKRIPRIAGFPVGECFACVVELLLVEQIESGAELRYGCEDRGREVWRFVPKTDDWAQQE